MLNVLINIWIMIGIILGCLLLVYIFVSILAFALDAIAKFLKALDDSTNK